MKKEIIALFTQDNSGNSFFTVLGKKDGKITASVSKDSGLESVQFEAPAELKNVKVNDTVTVSVDGDKISFKSTTPVSSGKQEKTTTPNKAEKITM